MNIAAANSGCVMTRENGVCTAQRIHSRPPREPSVRAVMARDASVTGAPNTSIIGIAIVSSMCPTMCMLNR